MIAVLAACGSGDGSGTRQRDAPVGRVDRQADAAPWYRRRHCAGARPPHRETEPPETAPPQTQPEQTAAPGTAPASSVATGDDGDGTVWWPWLLGALLLVVAIVAIASRRRPGPSWQVRATTMLDEIEQLTSHLAASQPPDGLLRRRPVRRDQGGDDPSHAA